MAKVTINDTEIEVADGTNMIEAAAQVGVEIPHYCYHPHLSIAGNCRMCLVDVVNGRPPVDIACNMGARDGMHIRTDTDNVKGMRQSVMEFLLVNHPLDCPICDQSGECRLQDYYMDHGQYESRGIEGKVEKHKRQDIADLIVLDAERCVHCSRCVRFGDEVTGTGELRLMNRSDGTEIGMFPGERITHHYQGNLADICPVGALTNADFRFQRRVWYLKETPSICTKCATGCNTLVCHQDGSVFRYLPRRNDVVNKSWMCDDGRLTYKEQASVHRILRPTVDGQPVEKAEAELARRIRAAGPGNVGFVLGTRATNEGNWAMLQVARGVGGKVFWVEGNDPGSPAYADDILVDADKNPNTAGVRLLAEHDGDVGDIAALLAADLKLLVVIEDDVVGRLGGAALPPVAWFGSLENATSRVASLVIPTCHPVEMDGTYVNRQERVQRIRRAVNPAGDAAPDWLAVDRLGAALEVPVSCSMVAGAFNSMARAVSRMKGMELKLLGLAGLALHPRTPPVEAAQPQAEAK